MADYQELVTSVCAEILAALQAVDARAVDALRQAINQAPRVFVAGRGRSGLQLRAFAMRIMHMGLTTFVVDDVTTPAIQADDLLLLGSGSGGTASLVQHAARAKALKARLALITATPASPIGQQADIVVHIPAASPKVASAVMSIQPMANVFEQSLLVLLDIVTIQMMRERGLTSEQMFTRHANLE